jgi:UDP-N-acetylmuramate dehydrogenase
MQIHRHFSLKPYNTFGIEAKAEHFAKVRQEMDLFRLLEDFLPEDIRILGGGSNLLLTKDLGGLTIKNEIKGIEIAVEDEDSVLVEVGAGEVWHDFVMWALAHDYGGVENLSLIPGTVGAAPIQNIGAYGVELQDVFEGLNAIHFEEKEELPFTKTDCQFGYRDSVFKHGLKDKLCINRVYIRLQKPPHRVNTSYGTIGRFLENKGISNPTIQDVSQAVISIRQSKLPDPKKIGNSGSFFKNPELPAERFVQIQERFPHIVSYPLADGRVKVPAGWLIDQCGFKGIRHGNTGCYENQALVLVNYGDATGTEISAFSQKVQSTVFKKFGIRIRPEVNIW